MLTRSRVAKRLGRSIATVRRLEGVELHPVRDERGVLHFDEDEVDAIAKDGTRSGGFRKPFRFDATDRDYLGESLTRVRDGNTDCSLLAQVERLSARNRELELALVRQEQDAPTESECDREERAQLISELRQVISELVLLGPRALARLKPGELHELLDLAMRLDG